MLKIAGSSLVLALAMFATCTESLAQGTVLRVVDSVGAVSETVTVPIELDITGTDEIAGFSTGVCHDGSALAVQSVDLGPILTAMDGGVGPEFSQVNLVLGEGFNIGVVFDFGGNITLATGTGYSIINANYLVLTEGDSSVGFCNNIGNPTVAIIVTTELGVSLSPVLQSGTVTGTPAPGSFRRGDLDGDGLRDESDFLLLQQYIFELPPTTSLLGSTPPLGCDLEPNQSGDINDNEVETIADLLMFREFLDCGTITVPGPSTACGDDPDDDTGGFDVDNPDPNYLISALTISITGNVDEERDVDIVLQILSPTPVKAVSLGLEIGSQLSPAETPLTVAAGVTANFFDSTFDGTNLVVAAGSTTCAVPMMPGGLSFQLLGTLHLKLAPFAIFPPAQWKSEVVIDGRGRRTTVVDDAFQDHNPFTISGTFEFARGNANNLDAAVNIADSVFILSYLFPATPFPLDCEDAADLNNDGVINIADPIFLLAFLFSSGDPIPSPFPECGFDIDIDLLGCDGAICP